ncbi:hypothetical protein FNX48_006505 [Streptomyces sp. IF17]|nr:hypothetical protein [Streptomyces alkaliphilus]
MVSKVPYAAYLRVYEPLTAFPEPERAHWTAYAKRDRLPDEQDEIRLALAGTVAVPPRAAPERESADAFVTTLNGVLCVCPWRTRLRSWLALSEVDDWLMPPSVLDAALPPAARRRAAAARDRWRERHPEARPWIRSALWHVPVRWFVLFSDEERRLTPASPDRPPRLRYRTPMVQARRRVARALRTVRRALPDGPLEDALVDVGRWLEEFHPRSLVELDYGGLVHTMSARRLAEDHSAADVASALAALAAGEVERADTLYEELTGRWLEIRERQFAN